MVNDSGSDAKFDVAGPERSGLLFFAWYFRVLAAAAAVEEGAGEEGGSCRRPGGVGGLEDVAIDLGREGLLVSGWGVYFLVGFGLAEESDVSLSG